MTKTQRPTTHRLSLSIAGIALLSCLLGLGWTPASALAKKATKPNIKAAITAQIVSLVAGNKVNIKVELTTVTPSPYILKLVSYSGIKGLRTLFKKESGTIKKSTSTKQRFQVVLQPYKVCKLTGQPSVFSFRIRCKTRKGCAYRSRALHRVTIKLNTENYCDTKKVTTSKP